MSSEELVSLVAAQLLAQDIATFNLRAEGGRYVKEANPIAVSRCAMDAYNLVETCFSVCKERRASEKSSL